MNIVQRLFAGAGLLLLALAVHLDQLLDRIKAACGFTPKHGVLRITELKLDFGTSAIPRRTKFGISALASLAVACSAAMLAFPHVHGLGWAALGLMGAAGSFANTAALNQPAPQYTFRGVYTGGSSDTSPLTIPFPSAFAALAAALSTAWTRTVVPICDVFVINALGSITVIAASVTNSGYVLTFTGALTSAVLTIGATIPNTRTQG